MVAQHEARRAHRSRREKVSGGRRSAQVVCSSVPHSHVSARALVRLARSMGFQGQIRPSHSVREPGRRRHDAQRRRTRAPAMPTIFTRCVGLVCTSATSGTRILVMASQRRGSCRLAPVQGSRSSEKETVKVYILLAKRTLTRSQGALVKVRGASGRALGRGGRFEPATLRAENPAGGSDPSAPGRLVPTRLSGSAVVTSS